MFSQLGFVRGSLGLISKCLDDIFQSTSSSELLVIIRMYIVKLVGPVTKIGRLYKFLVASQDTSFFPERLHLAGFGRNCLVLMIFEKTMTPRHSDVSSWLARELSVV